MASENETVASVADCIRHLADNLPNGVILNIEQCNFTADRIESAWRREKARIEADALNTGAFVGESHASRPHRNCDTVADFHDAKLKFKDVNAKGRANYCRRLCHWLLAPVADGGES